MADEGWGMDGFGSGMVTPDGRRSKIRSQLEYGSAGAPGYDGPLIDPSMSDQEVADRLREFYYENSAAWANPQQRADAMNQYALEGSPGSTAYMGRFKEATDLLDPVTRKQKWAITDAEFLDAYAKDAEAQSMPAEVDTEFGSGSADLRAGRRRLLQSLTDNYEETRASPLAHPNHTGVLSSLIDPEKPIGWYGNRVNAFPAAAKMYVTAEEDMGLWPSEWDALAAGYGNSRANQRYRHYTNTPVLDLPSTASPDELRDRLYEVQGNQQIAAEPGARERWLMTHNYDPPEWLKRASDFAMDFIDPSLAVDAASIIGGLAKGAVKSGVKGLAPALRNAGKEVAPDVAVEGAFMGLAGNGDVNYGTEEDPRFTKSSKQLETAREQRRLNEIENMRLPPQYDDAYNRTLNQLKQREGVRGAMGGIRN